MCGVVQRRPIFDIDSIGISADGHEETDGVDATMGDCYVEGCLAIGVDNIKINVGESEAHGIH